MTDKEFGETYQREIARLDREEAILNEEVASNLTANEITVFKKYQKILKEHSELAVAIYTVVIMCEEVGPEWHDLLKMKHEILETCKTAIDLCPMAKVDR